MLRHFATRSTCALLLLLSAACSDEPTAPSREELIAQLRTAAAAAALATPPTPATASPEALALGQQPFFRLGVRPAGAGDAGPCQLRQPQAMPPQGVGPAAGAFR